MGQTEFWLCIYFYAFKPHALFPYYREGKNSARENLLWEKFCPKFRDSIFTRILSLGTEFFPLFLRKV